MPGAFTFNLFYKSRDRSLYFIAVEPSSEKLGNLGKVTQPVHREARVRNILPLKSQNCLVRLARLRAKEPRKHSRVCPRVKSPGPAWLTF